MKKTMASLTGVAALLALLAVGNTTLHAEDPKPAGKTGSITGTVVDAEGKGVANVVVRVMPPRPERAPGGGKKNGGQKPVAPGDDTPPPPGGMDGDKPPGGDKPERPRRPVAETKTDAEGKFVIENIPVGEHMLVVRNKDGMANEKVTVEEDKPTSVSLALKKREPNAPRNGNGGAGGNQTPKRGPGGGNRGK